MGKTKKFLRNQNMNTHIITTVREMQRVTIGIQCMQTTTTVFLERTTLCRFTFLAFARVGASTQGAERNRSIPRERERETFTRGTRLLSPWELLTIESTREH